MHQHVSSCFSLCSDLAPICMLCYIICVFHLLFVLLCQPWCSQRSISGCFWSEQVLLDAQKAELPRAEREAKEASRFPSLGNNASWASLLEFDYCSCITCAVSLLISQVKRMLAVAELLILCRTCSHAMNYHEVLQAPDSPIVPYNDCKSTLQSKVKKPRSYKRYGVV